MHKWKWISGLLLIAAGIFIDGCTTPVGKEFVSYTRNSTTIPSLKTVDKTGYYGLFPGNGISPIEPPIFFHPGDQFGFQNQEGKVVGVYVIGQQSHAIPLDGVLTTDYAWKYEGEKQPG